MAGLIGHHRRACMVAVADGSARPVSSQISKQTLRAAFTPAGGDALGNDWSY